MWIRSTPKVKNESFIDIYAYIFIGTSYGEHPSEQFILITPGMTRLFDPTRSPQYLN